MVRNQLVSQIDQAVESLTDELTEFACTIFGIPTQNPPGNNYRQCAEAIGAMMQKIGMDVEYVEVPQERLSELAERDCAQVKRELGGLAAELGVNLVAGSVANVRGGKVYNTACVFDRAGNCVAEYDKTHLFTPMGEHAYFTPGDHLCRFRLDGHD